MDVEADSVKSDLPSTPVLVPLFGIRGQASEFDGYPQGPKVAFNGGHLAYPIRKPSHGRDPSSTVALLHRRVYSLLFIWSNNTE